MDVRVGVSQTAKEIHVELPDGADQDKVVADVEAALSSETGMLWLTDRKGRRVGIPSAKLAYVEVGSSTEERRVGFGGRT